jgi:hypothetical protein
MRWTIRARSRTVKTGDSRGQASVPIYPSEPTEVLDAALALREMVELITLEEFHWQEVHYDHHSEQGRELLFLIANHEWVRATSEIVDVVRSDVIETTIKTDIDLSQVKHEAFRGKSGRVWLPIAVLPPQSGQRQLEPDLFATVADAAGNLLPLLPADDLGHQMSAALAEIIVNMAVAHWPNWREAPLLGDQDSRSQVRPAATRDQRVLLAAAIYRLLRREPRGIGIPKDPASPRLTPADATEILRELTGGQDTSSSESGFSAASSRVNAARRRLLRLLDRYTVYLAQRACPEETDITVPEAEFVPELAERAVWVLQALAASTIVVVPVNFNTEPTVLTVRVPTRNLKPGWKKFEWRDVESWRISPRSWLIRPSAHLEIDVLLPTADADRQIQIRLADGVSFELPASNSRYAGSPLPRLDITVKSPPPLLELAASVRAVFEVKKSRWPASLTRALVDLANAKIVAASETLEHYQLTPGPGAAPLLDDRKSDSRKQVRKVQDKPEDLSSLLPSVTEDDETLASLRQWRERECLEKLELYRRASVDQFDPRTVVARVDMIEDVTQRATPEHAVVSADVRVDDRGYFSVARASTLMSLLLMTGVLAFLLIWHLVNNVSKPVPEVLAIVLTLFVTIQAGRIDRPDRSTLYGQLSGTGSLLIAASVFPAVMLAVALAFAPVWWAADIWAGVCVAIQAGFVGLTLWGPLTVIRSPSYQPRGRLSVGQRRNYETERLYYGHFEALRSGYWRNTTADALMIGRQAYGYLITQNTDNPERPASSTPPMLEDLLRLHGESGAADESSSVLALLHSSTQCRGVTFVVFRGKAAGNPGDDRLHIHDMEDLNLDADRLAPADNVSSTVDVFVGVDRHALPSMAEHPLIKVLQAAKNKLITLEAQLPVPTLAGAHPNRQWARVRVALRDTKDIHRLTDFLDEIYQKIVVPDHPGDLLAIQAAPTVQPRAITRSPADTAQDGPPPQKALLWGGDLDVSAIPAIADEPDDARTWHQIAIYADARSNIESDITQCLPAEYQHYQLAHLNYAVLHGTAEIILLLHKAADWPASDISARRRAGRPPTVEPDGETGMSGGQPRIVIDKNVSLRQLGPLTQHPLLRIRYRTQDRPGAFLNIVQAIDEFLRKESPPILREYWSISFARLQVATGQVALGHLTIRLHDVTQDRRRWNSGKTEQMAREVSARAALLATVGEQAGPPRNPDSNQNPVVHVDFISKDPPHQPTRPSRGKRTAPGAGRQL